MKIVFVDDPFSFFSMGEGTNLSARDRLRPFTFTRPISEIQTGLFSNASRFAYLLNPEKIYWETASYLTSLYPKPLLEEEDLIFINAQVIGYEMLSSFIFSLDKQTVIKQGNTFIAARLTSHQGIFSLTGTQLVEYPHHDLILISEVWDLLVHLNTIISKDIDIYTKNKMSAPIPKGVNYLNGKDIFIEQGSEVLFSSLNASDGPIYIGKNCTIMEGCTVRGPFIMNDGSTLKMGARIYGSTVVGKYSKVGGEISNSNIFPYTNKAHEGFLGNSILGAWCNLGAGSQTSNLKNNYKPVSLSRGGNNELVHTELMFLGLIMGDYCRSAIGTLFNTGTVTGIHCNIISDGLTPKYIPSFSWGKLQDVYDISKIIETISTIKRRRDQCLPNEEKEIFEYLFLKYGSQSAN